MDRSQFRMFLLLYVVLALTSGAASFGLSGVSDGLAEAYAAEPTPWLIEQRWFIVGAAFPFLMAALAGLVGLFRFRPWGRTLSLWTTLLLVPLIAVSGPTVSSPLQGALEYASTLAWAALLTIAYLPPVSDLFVAADGPATATTKHVDA